MNNPVEAGTTLMDAPEPEEAGGQFDPKAEITKLNEQLSSMTQRMEELNRVNMALMSEPKPAPVAAQPAPEPVEMPDPLVDPEGYKDALRKSVLQEVESRQAKQQSEAEAQRQASERYTGLWEGFQKAHPEHAADIRRVKYAAEMVAENLTKKGVNAENYMFKNSDQFMRDVVEVMDDVFGPVKPKEEPEPNRTGGLFGGLGSSAKDDLSPEAKATPFGGLREFQEKWGFHS